MANVTSKVTVDIKKVEVYYSGTALTVKKDSAISDNATDYASKCPAQASCNLQIFAELTMESGSTFSDGDEIAITVRAYAATGSRTNCALALTDWANLNDSSGQALGQWRITGSTASYATRTINIKLNSRAAGKAVLSDITINLGSRGVVSYGVGFDCIAKFKIASNNFAYGILARNKSVYGDSSYQATSGNNNAFLGIRTGAGLFTDLINSRGTSATPKDCLVEALYENAKKGEFERITFSTGAPMSLTEPEGCFVADHIVANWKDVWTQLTPNTGETYDAFKARILAKKKSYGFYPTSGGVNLIYYTGILGVDTPKWSDYRADVPEYLTNALITEGWYEESDKNALLSLYKSAIQTSPIVGEHITANQFATYMYYDTVLEDAEYPSHVTITYDPKGTASARTYNRTVRLTGMFGTVVVKPFAVTVMKFDDETKAPLAGASVKLQISKSGSWADYTAGDGGALTRVTGSNGMVTFENLALGTYRVLETATPKGYALKGQDGYDSKLNAVVGGTFVIASTDTEGAKVQISNKANPQKASVTYRDETDNVILKVDSFEGESGTPMTYDTKPSISAYQDEGYILVSNNYKKGTLFDDDNSVDQKFTVVLKQDNEMRDVDCSACSELMENAPTFVSNGVTSRICASLKNDTGLNPSLKVLHTDCEDIELANDCLIGMMDNELEKEELCDWKTFMHKFIPNVYQMFRVFGCTVCGLWTNIHNLWTAVNKLKDMSERIDCLINYMYKGASFSIGENTEGDAYAVAGKGVSFLQSHSSDAHASDISLNYIAGGLMRFVGSFKYYNNDFTDEAACGNYDNGYSMTRSDQRKGNSFWGTVSTEAAFPSGGELICELRIKRSSYPQIKTFFAGFGQEGGGGSYSVRMIVFNEGAYAYGQHGWCESDGTPSQDGYDRGHLVPDGWTYLQVRLTSAVRFMTHDGQQLSPVIFMGVRMNQDAIEC